MKSWYVFSMMYDRVITPEGKQYVSRERYRALWKTVFKLWQLGVAETVFVQGGIIVSVDLRGST